MHLRKQKRTNGRIYLSVVENYRTPEGKTRSHYIRSLGYLDELEKSYPDPVAHFQEEIDKQNAQKKAENAPVVVNLSPLKKIDKRNVSQIDMGAAIPLAYFYRDLRVWSFFERKRSARKVDFDPCRILELLVWNRLCNPQSKKGAWMRRERFPKKCKFSLSDIYRSLDYFDTYSQALIDHMNHSLETIRGPRDKRRLYFDVTNYYFEMDGEDTQGLRKKGVSKEHRPEAIVQMGLLIDAEGIPLDFELFSGNTTDPLTLLPTMKKANLRRKDNPEGERVVVVADKGLNTSTNIAACILDGNGYIFSQSVRKAPKNLKRWVLSDEGYETNPDQTFKLKERVSTKTVYIEDESGSKKKVEVPVKEVAFWSREYFIRSREQRKCVIEKSKAALERGDAASALARSSVRYTKPTPLAPETGEVTKTVWSLDEEKIEQDEQMDGYYCIVTSEIDWDAHDVIDSYRGLSRIEESFRVLKSTLDARPIFVWTTPHIRAHFLICYIALMIMRLMQKDVEHLTGKRPSADSVSAALKEMVGHRLERNLWYFDYRSDLTDSLSKVQGIDLSRQIMTKAQIRKVMSEVKKPRT